MDIRTHVGLREKDISPQLLIVLAWNQATGADFDIYRRSSWVHENWKELKWLITANQNSAFADIR